MTDRSPSSAGPGERAIRHYRVLDRIGSGGLGEVYRARDTKLGRTVAIKELAPDIVGDPGRREELLRDARAITKLSHPNIVALYEIIEDGRDVFFVFDFAAGESLKSIVGGQPLNPRRAVDLAIQVADALADAHADGIVHGDFKPDNIIVTPRGNARILDFGLSRWTRGGAARRAAAGVVSRGGDAAGQGDPATLLGTIAYLSPEQALGERGDARTDIFSLGVMLFEMLSGKLPFNGTSAEAMTLQIAQAQPPSVSSVNAALPRELDPILSKALSKSLGERYESAAALAGELRSVAAILDVRATVAAEHARPAGRPAASRRGAGVWLALLVVLALIAGAVYWLARGAI